MVGLLFIYKSITGAIELISINELLDFDVPDGVEAR
jgi:hypothetical protein